MPLPTEYGAPLFSQLFVGNLGETDPTNMIEVADLRGEPDIGTEASTGDLEGYGRLAAPKITVQGTLPDYEFEVNMRFGIPIHQAMILSGGIQGGLNVRPGTDADHPNELVLDQTGAIKATGAAAANDVAFAPGRVYSFAQVFRISASGNNAYFLLTGSVAGQSFGPRLQDNTIGSGTIAFTELPIGPLTLAS